MSEREWAAHHVGAAEHQATKSKDRSTQVGAIIVGPDQEIRSTGFNRFPRGVDDNVEERHERPLKYLYTEHAERNAIYNAARIGTALLGSTLVLNFCPWPCTGCARGVIQSGVARVIGYKNCPFPGKGDQWDEDLAVAKEMLEEAGVEIVYIEDMEE